MSHPDPTELGRALQRGYVTTVEYDPARERYVASLLKRQGAAPSRTGSGLTHHDALRDLENQVGMYGAR